VSHKDSATPWIVGDPLRWTMTPTMQITADEINCLIYSYLQDSGKCSFSTCSCCPMEPGSCNIFTGFQHTAFSLRIEGHLDASPYSAFSIRRGELVELLAKALLYSEVEAHWKADEISSNCKAPFSLLQDHVCSIVDRSDKPLPPVAATQSPRPVLQNGDPDLSLSSSLKRKLSEKGQNSGWGDINKRIRQLKMLQTCAKPIV